MMPVLTDKRSITINGPFEAYTRNNLPMFMPITNTKKGKRKGRKFKLRKQFISMTSMLKIDNEIDLNQNQGSKDAKSLESARSSCTKLPSLQPSQNATNNSRSNTPRSSPLSRQAPTLPLNLQPSAHERRRKIPLLSAIKPENEKAERDRFMRANFNYNPLFIYRFPAETEVLERLGVPSDKYLPQAILIMEKAIEKYGSYEEFEAQTGGKILNRGQIYMIIQRYLKRENMEKEILLNLSEELLSRASMTRTKGKPTLNVRIINLREFWVEGLLRHELGTHYLRSSNNRYQIWNNWKLRKDLNMKPANPTEEGLASLHSVLLRKDPCLWRAALLYYSTHQAAFMSFKELFRDLGRFVTDPYVRWDYCMRVKRGQIDTSEPGAFCKDQVYLEGALQILKNRKTIDFHSLLMLGKIAYEDIDRLKPQADFSSVRVPFFMEDLEQYHKYLDRIAEANGLTDEVLEDV